MDTIDVCKNRTALIETMQKWLDNTTISRPYVGCNCASAMADAALCVLIGIDGAQKTLKREGMIKQQ